MKPVKTPEKSGAPRKRSRASERLDVLDCLEAASLLRTDETFLRCGGPRPMKPRRHMAKKGLPKR